jgi:ATP phosphoribosyltransferase
VRASLDPDRAGDLAALAQSFGASLPFGPPQGPEVVLHCRAVNVFDIVAGLQALGSQDVTVRAFDYLFRATNPLSERLMQRIG